MPRYYNASNRPVRFNSNGQILGAGEWLVADETEEILVALEAGELVLLPDLEPEPEQPVRRSRRSRKTEE